MAHGDDLVFESFLKKRKDKMKFLWVQYWFRLQNTTFSFFLKKGGDAAYLRGQYHIHTVHAVREFGTLNGDYLFEITMKNGKKKILAAETPKLRAMWIETLWKAMQLIGSYLSEPARRRSDLSRPSGEGLPGTALGEEEPSKSLSPTEKGLPSPVKTMNSLIPEETLEIRPYHAVPNAAFAIYDVPRSWKSSSPAENNLGGREQPSPLPGGIDEEFPLRANSPPSV